MDGEWIRPCKKNGVNSASTMITWPDDVALALNYAGAEMAILMRFDRILAATVANARNPALAQLRLAWWRTQLEAPLPGSEGFEAIELFGAKLLPIIDGWERLLAPMPLSADDLQAFGEGRGGGIFALIGGAASAGVGWALADFARHCTDKSTAALARQMADSALTAHLSGQSKAGRILARLGRTKTISRWTLLRAAFG